MANLSDNRPVYNKTFSHKKPKGGKMKVGSLVSLTWNDNIKRVGVIVYIKANWGKVFWTTGDYGWYDQRKLTEETCK